MIGAESGEQRMFGQPDDILLRRLRDRQRLPAAVVSGVAAGLVGGFIWGALTGISGLHIEFVWLPMIGMGFLVGKVMAFFGRGIDQRFAWLGAGITALASVAGCVFSVVIAVAWQLQLGSNFFLFESGRLDAVARLVVAQPWLG